MSKVDRSSVFSSLMGNLGDLKTEQQELALSQIDFNPNQPRKYIDKDALKALAVSIQERGVLEPVLVRPRGKRYEVIAGERRTRAALQAGLKTIPVVVKYISDEDVLVIAVMENLQREDLNPVEETDGILQLLSSRLKKPVKSVIEDLRALYDESRGRAGNTGISKTEKEQITSLFEAIGRFTVGSFYTNRVPILSLPEDLLKAVRRGELNYTKAKLLARVKDEKERVQLLKDAINLNLSREELESRLKANRGEVKPDWLGSVKKRLTSKRLEGLEPAQRKQAEKLLKELEKLLS